MYFSYTLDLQYGQKPLRYPYSESDTVVAKNFFRRYQLNNKVFSYAVFFNEYTITDDDRLDLLAEKYYDDPTYDWILLITNNMIRGVYDWPMDKQSFEKYIDTLPGNPYDDVHHYETIEFKSGYTLNGIDVIALQGGLIVGEEFYNNSFEYFDGTNVVSIPGSSVSRRVSVYENEYKKNEAKRKIYILKKKYLQSFVNDFKRQNIYSKSSDFINSKLKKSS